MAYSKLGPPNIVTSSANTSVTDVEGGPGGPGPRMEYLESAEAESSPPVQSEVGGMCTAPPEPVTSYEPPE